MRFKRLLIKWLGLHGIAHIKAEERVLARLRTMGIGC